MFGLTLEKLIVVAVIAGIVVGPQRLAEATRLLAGVVRSLRAFVESTRARASDELGMPLTPSEWEALDLRRYDPRRIVREALADPIDTDRPPATGDADEAAEAPRAFEGLERVRPGQQHLVIGGSAHPRRIRIADLPADDPRRLRAEAVEQPLPAVRTDADTDAAANAAAGAAA